MRELRRGGKTDDFTGWVNAISEPVISLNVYKDLRELDGKVARWAEHSANRSARQLNSLGGSSLNRPLSADSHNRIVNCVVLASINNNVT